RWQTNRPVRRQGETVLARGDLPSNNRWPQVCGGELPKSRDQGAAADKAHGPEVTRRGASFGRPENATRTNGSTDRGSLVSGEDVIRSRGGGVSPLTGLANRRYRPLSHLS